jgi:hypothetical protein
MTKYQISDDQYSEVIEAESMDDAKDTAASSWKMGDWDTKCRVEVRVAELDDDEEETGNVEWVEVEVGEDPPEPECTSEDGHDWQSPYKLVHGLKDNPGVFSYGGTRLVIKTCCRNCGTYRKETKHGAQRNPGQCDTVEYEDADELSSSWVEAEASRND